jgi:hypothetical protein
MNYRGRVIYARPSGPVYPSGAAGVKSPSANVLAAYIVVSQFSDSLYVVPLAHGIAAGRMYRMELNGPDAWEVCGFYNDPDTIPSVISGLQRVLQQPLIDLNAKVKGEIKEVIQALTDFLPPTPTSVLLEHKELGVEVEIRGRNKFFVRDAALAVGHALKVPDEDLDRIMDPIME